MNQNKKPERMHTCATCAITRVVSGEPTAVPTQIKILVRIYLCVAEHPVDVHHVRPAGEL
jgi:hypothetical protein